MRHVHRSIGALLLAFVAFVGVLPAALPLVASSTPAGATKAMGSEPFNDILTAADAKKKCGLSRDQLAALMIAPTYPEAGGNATTSPSPMTLSRWDNQAALYAFGNTSTAYRRAFWHPGVGMWQFDSAGGWPMTAADAINTQSAANQAATTMAQRWCDSGGNRGYVWGLWYGCNGGVCESIYNEIFNGTSLNLGNLNLQGQVTRTGGMVTRSCRLNGVAVTCNYVNPALAQGNTSWTSSSSSIPTPITAPFYDINQGGREYRVWIPADTGYGVTVSADKPVTGNARTTLVWSTGTTLCDETAARGSCGRVATTPWGNYTAEPFGSLDAVTPGVLTATLSGWAIDPDTNNSIKVHVYVDGEWKAETTANVSRPDVGGAVPGYGNLHGYATNLSGLTAGPHRVCAYALNVGPTGSGNPLIACKDTVVEAPAPGPFTDVNSIHAFVVDIQWLVDNDITTGYADGTFRPEQSITRGALAAFLWRVAGEPAPAVDAPTFSDVSPSSPFATAIRWMAGADITTGYPDGTFHPEEAITRGAMAGLLWRFAGEPAPAVDAPTFSDVSPSSPFATAIRWMAGADITTGYADGTFHPNDTLSRQAMAAFLHRADPYLH